MTISLVPMSSKTRDVKKTEERKNKIVYSSFISFRVPLPEKTGKTAQYAYQRLLVNAMIKWAKETKHIKLLEIQRLIQRRTIKFREIYDDRLYLECAILIYNNQHKNVTITVHEF